jgi:murein L,D-transpeptidase YafK
MIAMKFRMEYAPMLADAMVLAMMLTVVGCMASGKTFQPPTQANTQMNQTAPPLPPLKKPTIEISKSAHTLTLFDGGKVVKTYRCCAGSVAGDKQREGDHKTPEGKFVVCYKNPVSKFTRSLGLNYPNEEDAARGLRTGLITRAQYDAIMAGNRLTKNFCEAVRANAVLGPQAETLPGGVVIIPSMDWRTLWKTPLGGEIMIHGAGATREGTAGCVGLEDADVLELYEAIPLGTPVVIKQ